MIALAARGLGVRRAGISVVEDVSLEVGYGQLVAVVGPNGAGKSTLLGALAGDIRPCCGDVRIDGRPLDGLTARDLARLRSVLPQQSSIAFPFTVADVVAMGRAGWAGTPAARDDDAVVAAALRATETTALAARKVTQLSGGEQARVALARVLAQSTPIVLLDEPTASLDLHHQERILGEARRLADLGRAVVVVLHDLTSAAAYADEVVIMAGGRVVTAGDPGRVLDAGLLSDVYDQEVHVLAHPVTGGVIVVPRPHR